MHYEEVVLTIFNYIALIRDSALELYHFEELKQLHKTFFRFREKGQPHYFVQSIALRLLDPVAEEPQDILSVGEDNMEWDEPAVRQLLDSLRPENARVGVMAKVHDPSVAGDGENWEVEKWYGTEYRVKKLPKEFLAKVRHPIFRSRQTSLNLKLVRQTYQTTTPRLCCLSQTLTYRKTLTSIEEKSTK